MSNKLVDFHAHILPGADHGSRDVKTSLKQYDILKATGMNCVVATPHFYPASMSVEEFVSVRNRSSELLSQALTDNKMKIALGAEVLVCEEMEYMQGLDKLTIRGTDCLLLELPFSDRNQSIYDAIENISKSFLVVLAHIDRYPLSEILNILECDNVFAQLNASSLSSLFVNKNYLKLIDCDKVVALASDIHGTDDKYPRYIKKAISRLGNERLNRIMSHSEDILFDAEFIN